MPYVYNGATEEFRRGGWSGAESTPKPPGVWGKDTRSLRQRLQVFGAKTLGLLDNYLGCLESSEGDGLSASPVYD